MPTTRMESQVIEIERTSAGLQTVIPGCERRTLPKSTTRADDTGRRSFLLWLEKSPGMLFTVPVCTSAIIDHIGIAGVEASRGSLLR